MSRAMPEGHVGERRDRPALVHALDVDGGVGRVEARIANEHDGHAVKARPRVGLAPIEAVSSVESHGIVRVAP